MIVSSRARTTETGDHSQDRGSRGQALVEFAIVLPVMLLVLLLAVDFGRLFFTYISVHNAAREGAFFAATHAGDSDYEADAFAAAVAAAARAQANVQAQGGEGEMSVTGPDCFAAATESAVRCDLASDYATGIGNQVAVGVSQSFSFATPLVGDLFGGEIPVAATATAPVLDQTDVSVYADPGSTATTTSSPTPTPAMTPTPAPSEGATASPEPICTVPDFFNTYFGDPDALATWANAGFTGELVDHSDNKKIKSQSHLAGSVLPCSVSLVVDDKV